MYRVDEAVCTGCGDCVAACPAGALTLVNGRARIADAICADCGSCAAACPQGAIALAGAANPADMASRPEARRITAAAAVVPAATPGLARRASGKALPAEPRRSRLWPMIGGALVWAARELLPEVIAAWRPPRAGDLQPISRSSPPCGLAALPRRRAGRRRRWGRA